MFRRSILNFCDKNLKINNFLKKNINTSNLVSSSNLPPQPPLSTHNLSTKPPSILIENTKSLLKKQNNLFKSHFKISETKDLVSSLNYCINLVRKGNYEDYLSTLLLPFELRRKAFVLRAFQLELAHIKEVTSDRTMGQMRVEFWREAINAIFNKETIPSHPVVQELNKIFNENKIQRHWFIDILDARKILIANDRPFSSIDDVEKTSDHLHSSFFHILLSMTPNGHDMRANEIASHLGKSIGLSLLCRSVPHHASNNRVFLPQDLLLQYQLSQQDVINKRNKTKIQDVIFELASRANTRMSLGVFEWSQLNKDAKLVFLSATSTKMYLKSLEKYNFDVFHPKLNKRNHFLPLRLLFNKFRGYI